MRRHFRRGRLAPTAAVLATLGALALLAGCGRTGAPAQGGGHTRLQVVAAENFWGSIATQLAGSKADVTSIIVNPDTDPHSYEPTARDARTMAGAQLAIVNGIGYDNWAPKLLAASPSSARRVLDVGDVLGLGEGANSHQWYSPSSVRRVVGAIVADLDRLDPGQSAYFAERERLFLSSDLARYDELRREVRARYAGTPVGYSESIFQPLGADLGLRLLTPYSFAKAIAEGTDLTAADKRAVDEQARKRLIKIWVFNSQNVTPDVERVNEIARERGIPIATVTETLSPASDSFEQWQVAELEGLARALHEATGR
ncbi:MAG TPA: zinc ABC transporter substrate-binding protein [Solirubrobacteraceae bacterium]|jgi:zinc/manganese transport system substrate-binding protein|nr:zinc ABC transporter substrate-binding protein [Solirubrobacteraceae bacterium]